MESAEDPAPSPEALADQARARATLDRVIGAMPLEVRAVFVSFELEGLTMAEIAEATDTPPGTVASRLRRGREIFSERVKKLQEAAR
jgi:RNA polymerase sigma-70 factor, ECF subfamily